MIAKPISGHGVIGLCSPSHVAVRQKYAPLIANLTAMGFRVKEADNLYSAADGYLATPKQRGDDFNQLIADDEVELVFFGGGEGSVELLPFIDLELIRQNPKRICSYSDATTILNTVTALTGLETYYGQSPETFRELNDYNREQFLSHLVRDDAETWVHGSPWRVLTGGTAEGRLIGGYSRNFAMWLGTPYAHWNPTEKYLLFIEDNEKYGGVDYVSAMLSNIEQMPLMPQVTGLLFGCYSKPENAFLLARLRRFGAEHGIPVIYCDDFGHDTLQAVLPIGRRAVMNESGLRFARGERRT